jgi:hypothetical protein
VRCCAFHVEKMFTVVVASVVRGDWSPINLAEVVEFGYNAIYLEPRQVCNLSVMNHELDSLVTSASDTLRSSNPLIHVRRLLCCIRSPNVTQIITNINVSHRFIIARN